MDEMDWMDRMDGMERRRALRRAVGGAEKVMPL